MKHFSNWLLGLAVALIMPSAWATVIVNGAEGEIGQSVTVQLWDTDTSDLRGATIVVSFDSTYLKFIQADPGDLMDPTKLVLNPTDPSGLDSFLASVLVAGQSSTGEAGSILDVTFEILPAASINQLIPVSFACLDLPGDPQCRGDYYLGLDTFGNVKVVGARSVPGPATLWLLALGLPLLAGMRFRR